MANCGLCGTYTYCFRSDEPINWTEYDGNGRNHVSGKSVYLNQFPETVQSKIKQKRVGIEENVPICSGCYSKTLDEIWVAETSLCKACNMKLEDIGYSCVSQEGHTFTDTRLMSCPKCRLVYFVPSRQLTK